MSDLFNSASISDDDQILITDDGMVVDDPKVDIDEPISQANPDGQKGPEDIIEEFIEIQEAKNTGDPGDDNLIDTEESTPSSTVKSGSSSVFVPFASALQEKGILTEEQAKAFEELEEGSEAEHLMEIMSSNVDNGINGWINGLPEDLKYILSNYKEGVKISDLVNAQTSYEDVSSLTDDKLAADEAAQEKIVRQFYTDKGFTPERIEKVLSRSKELGMLAEDSLELKGELVKAKEAEKLSLAEKNKAEQDRIAAQNEETINKIKEAVDATKEIVPGVKINATTRNKLFEYMTKPVGQDANGNPMSFAAQKRSENPIEFEKRLNYMIMQGMFDKDAKFDNLVNSSKTKALNKFEESMRRSESNISENTISANGMRSVSDNEDGDIDWGSALSGF